MVGLIRQRSPSARVSRVGLSELSRSSVLSSSDVAVELESAIT